jgi:hypothetical protein
MDEIKQDGCKMSGWDELLWLYEPTRKIAVPLQSIRTFLEMEYAIAIVDEANYMTQLP